MDWRTFIANLISSLAWPSVVVVFLILAKDHLGALFSRIEKLKLPGGTEAEFRQGLAEARQTADTVVAQGDRIQRAPALASNDPYLELATKFPEAAILEAYKEVERVITEWQRLNPDDKDLRGSPATVVRMLKKRGFIGQQVVKLFEDVTKTRNAAVHLGTRSIAPGEALEYRSVCRELMQSIAEGFEKFSED